MCMHTCVFARVSAHVYACVGMCVCACVVCVLFVCMVCLDFCFKIIIFSLSVEGFNLQY